MLTINWKVIIAIFAISLLLFFAVNYSLTTYRLNYSLQNSLINLDSVADVKLNKDSSKIKVELLLTEVEDFKNLFKEVERLVANSGVDEYKIIFNPQAYESFNEIYEKLNFMLYEVLATGQFSLLIENQAKYRQQYNLDELKFKIDQDYIYVIMVQDEEKFYQVIERRKGVTNNG